MEPAVIVNYIQYYVFKEIWCCVLVCFPFAFTDIQYIIHDVCIVSWVVL